MTIIEKMLAVVEGKDDLVFSRDQIIEAVITKFPGTNRGSVMPSDYCYNRTNKGNDLGFPFPLFEHTNGMYKYLGPKYAYTGDVFWKDLKIGAWENGVYKEAISYEKLKQGDD